MSRSRLLLLVFCLAAVFSLLPLWHFGLWRQWGLDIAEWYLALGTIGLLYCGGSFLIYLLEQQKKDK